jgi:ubiquinone/menaquinone biosynthesis C-methylase UbiE
MTDKRIVIRTLDRIGLLSYLLYFYQGHLKGFHIDTYLSNLRYRVRGAPDRLPIPPVRLIWLVIGSVEISAFLETGSAQVYELVIPMLERNGLYMQNFDVVLDFGCGCGRIMRYWRSLEGVELWGVDCNPAMIDWCRRNLDFARFHVNQSDAPLPFEAEKFDLIYARSVFTHLNESLQFAWMQELCRVLKPGGFILITVSGDAFAGLLRPDELASYRSNHLVVRNEQFAGQNMCAAFHPPEYVYQQWTKYGFEIVDAIPGGQVRYAIQDTYLARRRV